MYKKVDVLFVLDFLLSLKITHNISGNGKKNAKAKKGQFKKKQTKKQNLDSIFHILHSLTSGSTWDNTSDQQK